MGNLFKKSIDEEHSINGSLYDSRVNEMTVQTEEDKVDWIEYSIWDASLVDTLKQPRSSTTNDLLIITVQNLEFTTTAIETVKLKMVFQKFVPLRQGQLHRDKSWNYYSTITYND
ncbi:hypothetical protein Tco_0511159 [Tanacetum coccineum]